MGSMWILPLREMLLTLIIWVVLGRKKYSYDMRIIIFVTLFKWNFIIDDLVKKDCDSSFRREVFQPVWIKILLTWAQSACVWGANYFYLGREKRIGKMKKESNRKESQIRVIYTGQKLALCGGIIFLLLLCDLARIEGIVYKEFEGGKRKTFLRMTCNQEIFIFFCMNRRIWCTEIFFKHAEGNDQNHEKLRWADAFKLGRKCRKLNYMKQQFVKA